MTLDEQINILNKYGINSDELLFVSILLLLQDGENDVFISEYFNLPTKCRNNIRDLLISLQEKGIITKEYKIPAKGERFIPEDVTINKTFIKTFYKSSFDLGKELFELYPMFGNINGNIVSLRGVSKKFDSLEDFYRFYGRSIRWNPEKHAHILDLLDWAKNNTNFISCSISSFVIEHKWEELEALKNGDIANINFDSIKMV